MRKILILSFILSTIILQAQKQQIHLTYEQHLENDKPSVLVHKLFFSKKHAMSYNESYCYMDMKSGAIVEIDKAIPSNVVIYDKHNKTYKPLFYTPTTTGFTKSQISSSWKPVKDRVNSYLTGSQIDLYVSIGLESNMNIYDTIPKYRKTKSIRKIGEYNCKAIEYSHYGKSLIVWYTKEMEYNWANLDFKNNIPGMIVLIEDNKGEPVFELINVQMLNIKDILFTNDDLNNIMLEYKK